VHKQSDLVDFMDSKTERGLISGKILEIAMASMPLEGILLDILREVLRVPSQREQMRELL
jgi:hypothetical protein